MAAGWRGRWSTARRCSRRPRSGGWRGTWGCCWPWSRLPVLTAGEREQVVAGWNDTAAAVPDAGGVHELITGRAGACPDAVAVLSGDACLTYRALMDRVGRLAGYLREQGAGPESVVGLCLGRGAGMVTAVLAAWLAGAAYLP